MLFFINTVKFRYNESQRSTNQKFGRVFFFNNPNNINCMGKFVKVTVLVTRFYCVTYYRSKNLKMMSLKRNGMNKYQYLYKRKICMQL